MTEEWICPECGSDYVTLLTLWDGNQDPLGCQKCYFKGQFADFTPGDEETDDEDRPNSTRETSERLPTIGRYQR